MTSDRYQLLTPVVKIGIKHDTESFDCGHPELSRFLKRLGLVKKIDVIPVILTLLIS